MGVLPSSPLCEKNMADGGDIKVDVILDAQQAQAMLANMQKTLTSMKSAFGAMGTTADKATDKAKKGAKEAAAGIEKWRKSVTQLNTSHEKLE